ncbi:MAG: hypothetical protein Q7T55_13520 [Solirubrobacteraceae bacterium]|nr:hypothetical protein [Solirubrobacteraceae bacterium]
MAILAWVMMGLAIWHFMIWLPDRHVGGIVGSFLVAGFGGAIGGLAINGFTIPGEADLGVAVALEGIPGTIIALGLGYAYGSWRENAAAAAPKAAAKS